MQSVLDDFAFTKMKMKNNDNNNNIGIIKIIFQKYNHMLLFANR